MNFPAIDPIAFTIGPLAVRWYSLSYIIGILIGLILINKFIITFKKNITKNDVYDLLNYLILGIIIEMLSCCGSVVKFQISLKKHMDIILR